MKLKNANIIVFDIETSPNVGYFWRPGSKVSISFENIIEERKIICICWKFLGHKKINSLTWDKNKDDKEIIEKFSEIINSSDGAIGHNGDNFDIKWLKGRAVRLGTTPITNVHSIDTLKLSRANFNLNSHRLDYLGEYLGLGRKMETGGYGLWKDVMAGSKKALRTMVKYCKRDVQLLDDVFSRIVPYVDRLPFSMSVAENDTREGCPSCGSPNVQRYGTRPTKVGRKQRYLCSDCGTSWTDPRLNPPSS